jgi:hypothetical protein
VIINDHACCVFGHKILAKNRRQKEGNFSTSAVMVPDNGCANLLESRKPRRATTRALTPQSGRTIESTNAPIDVLSRSISPPLDEPSRTTELEKPPWDGPTSTFNLVKQV